LTLQNFRKWSTLVHPRDIEETNFTTTIPNITQVYNEEQKFPEMSAYCVSKIFADWKTLGQTENTQALTPANVIEVFNSMMLEMSNNRVPEQGRILYVTPAVKSMINNATSHVRNINLKDGVRSLTTSIEAIDLVQIKAVPPELMGTSYDFTQGWAKGTSFKQINMLLIHPLAVITPIIYNFAKLDEPHALSEGKWVYYEESYEDVFILPNKETAIAMNITP